MHNTGMQLARKRSAVVGVIAILAVAVALLAMSSNAEAYPQPVTGGYLNWGVKESFRQYITGPIAQGQIIVSETATQNGNGTFRFPARVTGSYDNATGNLTSGYQGKVRFVGHAGALDMTISDIKVNKTSASTGVLIADVYSRSLDDGQFYTYNDINFADLTFTGHPPTVSETSVSWSNVPAKLTQQGVPGFANFYQAGDDLDPVSPSLIITDNCPSVVNPGQENADGDEYGDACEAPQCVNVINHWTIPNGDSDCDGYPDSVIVFPRAGETAIGTLPNTKCAATSITNDEAGADAWPVDFNDNQLANIADILSFNTHLNPAPYNARWDLNANGVINIADILQFNPFFGLRCSP